MHSGWKAAVHSAPAQTQGMSPNTCLRRGLLIAGRENTSHMRLISGETSTEQDIFAAYSIGMTPLEIAHQLQLKETEVKKVLHDVAEV